MPSNVPRTPTDKTVTTVVASVALVLGLIGAIGCFIAALFERDGFGRPRDSEPRSWYLALLVLGVVTCIAVPGWIAARAWGRAVGAVCSVIGLLAGGALLGLAR